VAFVKGESAPERTKFFNLATLKPIEAFGAAMKIAAPTPHSRHFIEHRTSRIYYNSNHSRLEIPPHAAETGALRRMISLRHHRFIL
jgi:hypothetical protein